MANYTRSTNFTAKDALASGNPAKIILGSEHDAEYDAIATAISSKQDNINSLASETTVDIAADYLAMYDDSAGATKKVLVGRIADFINDYSASAATSLDIETGIDSTKFSGYILRIIYMYPSTNATTIRMRIKSGGVYQTTSYSTVLHYVTTATPGTLNGTAATDGWDLTVASNASSTSANALSGVIELPNSHDATSYLKATGSGVYVGSGGGVVHPIYSGYYGSGGGLQGIRFFSSSGNINGKIILYGVRQ